MSAKTKKGGVQSWEGEAQNGGRGRSPSGEKNLAGGEGQSI